MTRRDTTRTRYGAVLVVALLVVGAGAALAATATTDTPDAATAATNQQLDGAGPGPGPGNGTCLENCTALVVYSDLGGVVGPTQVGNAVVYATPAGSSFTVSNLSAPANVTAGENVTVTADVTNPNEFAAVRNVEFRLDGALVERRPFALNPGETDTVTFEVSTEGVPPGTYSHGVFTDADGAIADITVEEAPAENATVQFDDQVSDGTTVTVDSVTLPEGGYVVVHDTAALSEGDAIGSTIGVTPYLEPGTHENVTVTLFDVPGATFNETALTQDATLTAMAHMDTDGNQTFDFVATAGAADGPYTVDSMAVVDEANVTVETGAVTTTPPETTTETTTNETTTNETTTETTTEMNATS